MLEAAFKGRALADVTQYPEAVLEHVDRIAVAEDLGQHRHEFVIGVQQLSPSSTAAPGLGDPDRVVCKAEDVGGLFPLPIGREPLGRVTEVYGDARLSGLSGRGALPTMVDAVNPFARRLNQRWVRRFGERAREPGPEVPCIPCAQNAGVRQFSLNPPPLTEIGDDNRPVLTPDMAFTFVDDAVVLYHPATSVSHILNASAALVWAEVDDQLSVGEIVDALTQATGMDRAVLDRDVKDTLGRFRVSGIVRFDTDTGTVTVEDDTTGAVITVVDERPAASWTAVARRILDEQPWPLVIGPVQASGLDLVVRTNATDAAAGLRAALGSLPPTVPGAASTGETAGGPTVVSLLDRGPGRARRLRLYVDGTRRWSADRPEELLHRTRVEINQLAIDRTGGRLRFHAGAVERDGEVVMIAGDSGRGKSTLTAALVQRGFAYLTDELAAIDPETLAVLPYPKAVDLDVGSHDLLGLDLESGEDVTWAHKRAVTPGRLGSVSPGGRLVLVVLLNDEIATNARSDAPPAPGANAVVELIGLTFGPSFEDDTTLDMLARIATTVPMLRLPRGTLPEACARIEAELAARPRPA
jgi:hypothetical protein